MQVTCIRETCISIALAILLGGTPLSARAQAGPPFLSNDPGTPDDGIWEINLAIAPTVAHDGRTIHVPQFDLNFRIGDRTRLTYDVPWFVTKGALSSTQGGR